jgi:hypothetical protein
VAVSTTNSARPGVVIILIPSQKYLDYFEPIKDGPYYRHGINAYRYLLRLLYQEVTGFEFLSLLDNQLRN